MKPPAVKKNNVLPAILLAPLLFTISCIAISCGNTSEQQLIAVETGSSTVASPTALPAIPSPTPLPSPTPSPTPIPSPTPTNYEQGEIDGITRSPFNGTAVSEESLSRRVLAIKMDNHLDTRPQSGIDLADMIVEIWVEGITRSLAIFRASDSDFVGPMRSLLVLLHL